MVPSDHPRLPRSGRRDRSEFPAVGWRTAQALEDAARNPGIKPERYSEIITSRTNNFPDRARKLTERVSFLSANAPARLSAVRA